MFQWLDSVYSDGSKYYVSNPFPKKGETISIRLRMLSNPDIGGGIRPISDMFLNYLKSEYKNTKQLIEYALKLNNGAVFKRLGFLLEQYAQTETTAIEACSTNLTKGNAKLDPTLPTDKLITRWRLWVPKNWKKDKLGD